MSKRKIVRCPTCGKRVLDIEAEHAVLYIKCNRCKQEHRVVCSKD